MSDHPFNQRINFNEVRQHNRGTPQESYGVDHGHLAREIFRPEPMAYNRRLGMQADTPPAHRYPTATEMMEQAGILPRTRIFDPASPQGGEGNYRTAQYSPENRYLFQQASLSSKDGLPMNPYDMPAQRRDAYAAVNPYDMPAQRRGEYPGMLPNAGNNQAMLNQQFDQWASMGQASRQMQQLPGGAVYFRAGMAIDADGAPDARRIDPAGSPSTSLRYSDGSSVNAKEVPYIVLPSRQFQKFGIHPGDIAAVRYNGNVQFAVFADIGPSHKIGEGSMALAAQLGINPSPTRGGVPNGVEYIVFPRSGDRTPGHPTLTAQLGAGLLAGNDTGTMLAMRERWRRMLTDG